MLTNISKLGKVLSTKNQKAINGGNGMTCSNWVAACGPGYVCQNTFSGPKCVPQ